MHKKYFQAACELTENVDYIMFFFLSWDENSDTQSSTRRVAEEGNMM